MPQLFLRCERNPILSAGDWPYPVNAVFNPGATIMDGETVLLCRVEDKRGVSHLTVARSTDGVSGWRIDSRPLICGEGERAAEQWGVEDPRITRVDELGGWVIAYTAYGPEGPCVALSITQDFRTAEFIGVVMPPEDKNASLLPRHVNGKFVLFHRPHSHHSGRADVWLSRSEDLRSWAAPEPVFGSRPGPRWDSLRVGMGPPPIETEHGWLGVYHGVKEMVGGPVYRMGLVLLDLADPAKVLRRSSEWVLAPEATYERTGDVPNVIFPTGLVHDSAGNQLRVYYGAADSVIGMAYAQLPDVMDVLLAADAG